MKNEMKVGQLIKILQGYSPLKKVMIASDEEWNTLFQDVFVSVDQETNRLVICGLSGSEL